MKKFLMEVLAGAIGTLIMLQPFSCIQREKIEDAQATAERAHVRLNSFFYEFADECTWLDLKKEQAERLLGEKLGRRSDNRPPEVIHLYACINYKDYTV